MFQFTIKTLTSEIKFWIKDQKEKRPQGACMPHADRNI